MNTPPSDAEDRLSAPSSAQSSPKLMRPVRTWTDFSRFFEDENPRSLSFGSQDNMHEIRHGWLQSFTRRRSSTGHEAGTVTSVLSDDRLDAAMAELKALELPDEVHQQLAMQKAQSIAEKNNLSKNIDPRSKKWSVFNYGYKTEMHTRKISEMDEQMPETSINEVMTLTSPAGTVITSRPFSILKVARKMSARDLNAISPCGDL